MKFPKFTVILVTAAVLFVLWEQSQSPDEALDASRFQNLQANPVERGLAADYVVSQIPSLCEQTTDGSEALAECTEQSEARTSSCRRAVYDRFPDIIASDRVFRDLSISMMNCLMPQSGVVEPASQ